MLLAVDTLHDLVESGYRFDLPNDSKEYLERRRAELHPERSFLERYTVLDDKDAFERIIAYVTKKPYTVWATDVGAIGCRKEGENYENQGKNVYILHGDLEQYPPLSISQQSF